MAWSNKKNKHHPKTIRTMIYLQKFRNNAQKELYEILWAAIESKNLWNKLSNPTQEK
jgi:hypothetical protein